MTPLGLHYIYSPSPFTFPLPPLVYTIYSPSISSHFYHLSFGSTHIPQTPPADSKDKRPNQPATNNGNDMWEGLFAYGDAMKVMLLSQPGHVAIVPRRLLKVVTRSTTRLFSSHPHFTPPSCILYSTFSTHYPQSLHTHHTHSPHAHICFHCFAPSSPSSPLSTSSFRYLPLPKVASSSSTTNVTVDPPISSKDIPVSQGTGMGASDELGGGSSSLSSSLSKGSGSGAGHFGGFLLDQLGVEKLAALFR